MAPKRSKGDGRARGCSRERCGEQCSSIQHANDDEFTPDQRSVWAGNLVSCSSLATLGHSSMPGIRSAPDALVDRQRQLDRASPEELLPNAWFAAHSPLQKESRSNELVGLSHPSSPSANSKMEYPAPKELDAHLWPRSFRHSGGTSDIPSPVSPTNNATGGGGEPAAGQRKSEPKDRPQGLRITIANPG